MDSRRKDLTSALITATVIATTAVIAAASAISYILYKRYKSLKELPFSGSSDGNDDMFNDSVSDDIETIVMNEDD